MADRSTGAKPGPVSGKGVSTTETPVGGGTRTGTTGQSDLVNTQGALGGRLADTRDTIAGGMGDTKQGSYSGYAGVESTYAGRSSTSQDLPEGGGNVAVTNPVGSERAHQSHAQGAGGLSMGLNRDLDALDHPAGDRPTGQDINQEVSGLERPTSNTAETVKRMNQNVGSTLGPNDASSGLDNGPGRGDKA